MYIPPTANVKKALDIQLTAISKLQNLHPDENFIVVEDIHYTNLKTVPYILSACYISNILDQVYNNIREGCKVFTHPNQDQSDHGSLFLTPAYRPLIKKTKPGNIKNCPEDATINLQDWSNCTTECDIPPFHCVVFFFLHPGGIDDIIVNKQIGCYQNIKPWMTRDVKLLLRDRAKPSDLEI